MTKKIKLFKKQLQFFKLKEKEALFECGIGYGKSRTGSLWLANQCQIYPKTKWFMAARDYKQLKTAVDEEFEFYLHDVFGLERGVDYEKTSGSPIVYEWKNGTKIFGVGAHNYDTVFRSGNYNGIWGDEVDYWKPEAVRAARGRIRRWPELKRWTSSPDGYNHIYEDFYVNKVGPVINAPTTENPTLSADYIETLRKTYSPSLFEQEVMAKRLNLKVGKVYSEFDRDKHVTNCAELLEETDTIYFFTDYNVAHYCGCYFIHKKGKVYCIGEEHLEYKTTREMAYKVRTRFPDHTIIVCGDSSGNNKKDVAIEKVNYAQFEEAGLLTMNFRNPPVHARIISANSNLHHGKVEVDESCTTTIKDLELVSWKEGANEIDKSNINLSHASDAFTYGLWHFLSVKLNRKSNTIQL